MILGGDNIKAKSKGRAVGPGVVVRVENINVGAIVSLGLILIYTTLEYVYSEGLD